jgi:hypothetical protein
MATKMMSQDELVEKGVIEADALATGGEIPPEDSEKFLDYIQDETALHKNARLLRIKKGDKWRANKIGVGNRVAMKAVAAQDPGVRNGITTSTVDMQTDELIVPLDIGDGFLETNIEGSSVKERIVKFFATKTATNVEELWLNGNTLGYARHPSDIIPGASDNVAYIKDEYLGMFDGLLRTADQGHQVDAGGENFGVGLVREALASMPTKFRANRNNLRLMGAIDMFEIWRERVSGRSGPEGVAALGGGGAPKPFGLAPVELALYPFQPRIVEHVTFSGTTPVSLRHKYVQNLVVHPSTLGALPKLPYTLTTDYTLDAAAGVITAVSGGAFGSPPAGTYKVTYETAPQLIITHKDNIILGVSRDIRIERARSIHRRVDEFVITMKVGFALEEPDALVKISNLGTSV